MLDAFLKGMLIFFALIGIMEFIYILYSVFALRVLRSDFWIVVRPQDNESLEAVIRSLKSCVDETLVKQTQASVIILSDDDKYDGLCESCNSFASVRRCTAQELAQIVASTQNDE